MGVDQKLQRLAALQTDHRPKGGKSQGKGGKSGGSPSPLNEAGICKFFAGPGGCRYGRSCVHPHGTLSPSDNKCFNCDAEGHSMSQCDRPTAKASAKPSYPPAPKLPTSQRPDPKANPKANPKSPESAEPAPKTTAKPKRNSKGRKLGVGGEAGQTTGQNQRHLKMVHGKVPSSVCR